MARFLKDKQKSKGAAPGSLIFIGRQKMDYSCIRVTQYNAEYVKEGEVKALDKISEYLSDDHVVWISVRGLQDTNLIGKLGKKFDISALILEDILNTDERPKFIEDDKHLFVILKSLNFNRELRKVQIDQISLIVGKNYLISIQETDNEYFEDVSKRIYAGQGKIRSLSSDYLCYAMIDTLVDNYILNIEKLGNVIEEQEKLGAIKIANQIKERETKVAETRKDQDIAIAETKKLQEISVANADKDRISQVAIANAEKESQVAKAEAEKNIRIEQANTEKESRIAELNSDMEIKQAEAAKKAAIGRNDAQKEVALSNADLAVTQANADKQAGEAAARSEAAVQTAREIAQKEVEEAKARKVESSLKAEKIVPAEISRQEAILQANAIAEKITREAEARAKATLAQAEAEAKAIQLKLEAEAEGKKRSLLAEAEGFEAMVRAAESNPAIAIQYKMVDQWKEIAGEQVKAFEHINLGNITVFDGGNGGTSNFLNTLVKTVAPSLGVLDKLPIGETVKGIINPENKTEEKPATKAEEKKK